MLNVHYFEILVGEEFQLCRERFWVFSRYIYSRLSNKRDVWNKQDGGNIWEKIITVMDEIRVIVGNVREIQ